MGRTANLIRVSQPPWLNPAIVNGFGFVPRGMGLTEAGGPEEGYIRTLDQILVLARVQPYRVLTMLPDVVPEVGKAVWNDMRLGCGEGAVRLRAMTVPGAGGGDVKEAPDGTEAIKNLFSSLPPEIGSFEGALRQNFLMALFSGMAAVEAVPGARNKGVAQVWPLDTLSLRFKRNADSGLMELWQRIRVYGLPATSKAWNGFMPLPMERVFWSSIDGFPGDPYGRAPLYAALMPMLDMIAFMKDLLLAWHRVGTPKWDIGFDYEMHARIAKDIIGLTTKEDIQVYVQEEFDSLMHLMDGLQADDIFAHDIKSKLTANGSGGAWPNVKEIYEIVRWRLITALKQMPTLMGVVEGNTETWSSVDWQIYAKGLQSLVQIAADPLIRVAQLHLQLLGMPYTVDAEFEPIRANQRMVDAQSEQIELQNELTKIFAGFETQDEGSIRITGSSSVAPMDKEALGAIKANKGDTGASAASKPSKGPSKAT